MAEEAERRMGMNKQQLLLEACESALLYEADLPSACVKKLKAAIAAAKRRER